MSSEAAADMPRAKRLKMLREAKARKERGETGGPIGADAENAALDRPVDAHEEATEDERKDVSDEQHLAATPEDPAREAESDDAADESELLTLAPKRANWDIERDIAPMLQKLEKRTQYAIVEILREKLAAEQEEGDGDEEEEDEEDDEEDDGGEGDKE